MTDLGSPDIFSPKVTSGEIAYLGARINSALENTLISSNETDSNFEAANVVDGLFAIARGLHHVARAVERLNGLEPEAKA